jgi:hypothetical protein
MLHTKTLPAQPRFAEDDQPLPGRNHLLDVMHIEPAQHQRLAQRVRVRLLERGLENFLPAAKAKQPCLRNFSAEQDRRIAFVVGELGEPGAVFVATRVMAQQILYGFDLEPLQRR